MTNARRLLGVGAFLGIVAVVSFSHGQSGRPTAVPAPASGYLSTPAQERANDKTHEQSRFAKGGVFTYRPGKEEQLFAVALQPGLPASAVKGRDYLIMVSLSATQAGEGWLASTRIAETMLEMVGDNDRVSLWTIGSPKVTKSLLSEADGFLSPKNPDHLKKLKAALVKLQANYPAGDTDLKGGIAKAVQTFDGNDSQQRILLFLGDGQSTHNPIEPNDRFALCQDLIARKVGFFPVPLGVRVHAENLHGLATGSGGVVLRTRVGEELLVDCMKRYFEAFKGSILYGPEVALPASVKFSYPTKLPPLRGDASTLIVGSMQPTDASEFRILGDKEAKPANASAFRIQVKGTPVGAKAPLTVEVAETVLPPNTDNYFLTGLTDQWKNAKDRPALLRGDRTLASAYVQTQLNRENLIVTAELALKDLKPDVAARAFEQIKIMAPHDPEPLAGLRVAAQIKAGQLPPDAMRKIFASRTGAKLEKGKWLEGAVVKVSLPDNQAAADDVPAPGGQGRDDLLQQARDLRIVQEQKWTEMVENTLRQARRELQLDPDGTLDSLRNILSRVTEHPDLSDRVRTALAARLTTQLREATAQASVLKIRKEESIRNAQVISSLAASNLQSRTLEQREAELLRNFRRQIENAYFDEKTKVEILSSLLAMQTENRLRGQPWPVAAQADYEMVLAGYNLEQSKQIRRQSEDRYLSTMLALDRSFIPFPDEPGIEFPNLATWKHITQFRKNKYEVGYIPDEPKGRQQSESMLKLLEEEIDIPEEFRKDAQPVPMRLVLSYFDEKLSARGRGLPVYIDQSAFKEANMGDPLNFLETSISFPYFMKKMPIAVALRVALSQMPTNNATYTVRPGFLEITTTDRAIMEKVLRVHPVADLTIPISSAGATQQFGQAGQTQIGGVGALGGGLGALGGGLGALGGGLGIGGGIGGIGGGGLGALGGGIGGIGGGIGGFQQGSALGGTNASFNGGSFSGGFNGSLGQVGGTAGMQQLIKLITVVVDPGHWYYVQQQSPFQQGINNAFNNQALGNLGGGLGGGGALGGGLAGALGGAGGNAGAAGAPPTLPSEGGPASLLDPTTNTLYPYLPTLGLIVRAQTRTHTSLTGGTIGGKNNLGGPMIMKNDGVVPLRDLANNKNNVQFAGAKDIKGPKNKINPITELLAKEDPSRKGQAGKALPLQLDPKVWDSVLGEPDIPANLIIATAETLFEQPDKKHAVEFLKANLRRGLVVRPWVFEALAIALEATGGDADEIRRARLSAVALDPKDAEGFLEAARTMAENGQYDRALAFCRQAALIEPNLVFSYDQALVYAEQSKDARAMEWAASRLVSQDWPVDNQILHLKAQTRVHSLAQSLDRNARKSDADKLRAALQNLKERDVVIHLTWETSQEPADLELFVKEPTGSICSYDQKQTTGGGILLTNDLKTPNKISYIAAQGFTGTYEITVRKLWGRPLFGRARLEIIQNLGTPKQTSRLEIIDLSQTKSISVRLEEGRRSELAAVSPANLKKAAAKGDAEKTVGGYEQIRRLSYPETTGGGARNAGASLPAAARVNESIPQARTSATPSVGAGVNLEVRMSSDQKSMNVVMQPVYQTLKNGRPASNLSVVPGAK